MKTRPLWFISLLVVACGGESSPSTGDEGVAGSGPGESCQTNDDCSDDEVCNGQEKCDPENEDADHNGCVAGVRLNCDDEIDCTIDTCSESEGGCQHEAPDLDGDGHKDESCEDDDGNALGDDCDDDNGQRFPGNLEICDEDSIDEDCNGETFGDRDLDGDGEVDGACCNMNGDEELCGTDCDDTNLARRLGQVEFCDDLDNDCDGEVDDNPQQVLWYADADGDLFGAIGGETILSCYPIDGASILGTDCRDDVPGLHPAQQEICDDLDNDCNGEIDDHESCGDDGSGGSDNGSGGSDGAPNGSGGSDIGSGGSDTGSGGSDIGSGGSDTGSGGSDTGSGGSGGAGGGTPMCAWTLDNGISVTVTSACDESSGEGGLLAEVAVPTVPAPWDKVGPGATVTNPGTWPDPEGLIAITLDAGELTTNVVMVRIPEDGPAHPIASTVSGSTFTADLVGPGTYTLVRVVTTVLPGCDATPLSGSFAIANQQDLNLLDGASEISGNLTITADDITNLEPLSCLRSIGGTLSINTAAALQTASGLENLLQVGGSVYIYNSDSLLSIPLSDLTFIGGYLTIDNNNALESAFFNLLPEVKGTLTFTNNGASADDTVFSMESLTRIQGNFALQSNPALKDLDGFSLLKSIAAALDVRANADLEDTTGLDAVTQIGTYVYIYNNDALLDLSLASLGTPGTYITVDNNNALELLDLSSAQEVNGNFTFTNNGASSDLTTIDMSSLTRIRGAFAMQANPEIQDLNGFANLDRIDTALDIRGNVSLVDTYGLDGLTLVETYVYIYNNDALLDLSLASLGTPGTYISIDNNNALELLDLSSVEEVNGNFTFTNNGASSDLTVIDMSSLTRIRGAFTMQANPELENLNGFANLDRIDTALDIRGNVSLVDTYGLDELTLVETYVYIYNNDGLLDLSLASLGTPGTYITVDNNNALELLDLSSVEEVNGNFTFTNNGASSDLTTIDMSSLTRIRGAFTMQANPELENLDGFLNLDRVDTALIIRGNISLVDTYGLDGLTLVETYVYIYNNNGLLELSLPSLGTPGTYIAIDNNNALELLDLSSVEEVNGNFTFTNNGTSSDLTTIDMSSLTRIRGAVSIAANPKLLDLVGFGELARVDGTFDVRSNATLQDMSGLDALIQIDGNFIVYNHAQLSTLAVPLQILGGSMTVTYNPMLPTCDPISIRNAVQALGWNGAWTIANNLADTCSGT